LVSLPWYARPIERCTCISRVGSNKEQQQSSGNLITQFILHLCQEPSLQVSMQTTCCMCKLWRQIQCCIYKMCVFQGRTWREIQEEVQVHSTLMSKIQQQEALWQAAIHPHTHTHTPTDTTAHKKKKKEKLGNVRNLASKLIAVEIHQMVVGSLCMM
jgi:hypothetical protein